MPKIISVDNHRFPGPNKYYALPGPWPGGSFITMVSPGILVAMFPDFSSGSGSPGTGARYSIVTNTITAQSYPYQTYPNLEGAGVDATWRKGFACSLGGGFALAGRIDTVSGASQPVKCWLYNDATRSFSSLNAPPIVLSEGSPAPNIAAYQLGENMAFLETGTQAFKLVKSGASYVWSSAPDMPRFASAAAHYGEGLLYIAGSQLIDGIPIDGTYVSAPSFSYSLAGNAYTELNHTLNLSISSTTGRGVMARLPGIGVVGVGPNNYQVYSPGTNSILIRPRSETVGILQPLRTQPATYLILAGGTNRVYSW